VCFDVLRPRRLHDRKAAFVAFERAREVTEKQPDALRAPPGKLIWVSVLQQVDQVLATGVERLQSDMHGEKLSRTLRGLKKCESVEIHAASVEVLDAGEGESEVIV
jgi:hypothetical protein